MFERFKRKNLYLLLSIPFLFVSCSNEDSPLQPVVDGDDAVYEAPSYADDYSGISSWENRSMWNLANVHDPSVSYDDGYYYMYTTDASYGNAHESSTGHYLTRRSKDLVNWEFMGMSISGVPSWIGDSLNNIRGHYGLDAIPERELVYGFWAPAVNEYNGKYRMYYSVVIDNYIGNGKANLVENFDNTWTERSFIGLRESSSLAMNLWSDRGMVVTAVSDKGYQKLDGAVNSSNQPWYRKSISSWIDAYSKYNAIDPAYFITDDNHHWLIYGSWHSGIVALELNPETGLPLVPFDMEDESTWGKRIYTRTQGSYAEGWNRWQGSEGAEVIYHEETGYYYLFLAYDGLSVDYNTRVVRSRQIDGPYEDFFGYDVTNGTKTSSQGSFPILTHPYQFNNHSGWVGFSHCCVFQHRSTGDWFYSSQARLPENTNGNLYSNAIMMGHVNKVRFTSSGWPVVMPERYAAVPEEAIEQADLEGSWEVIVLNYEAGVQQKSVGMILNADGSATGALSGSWSYDEAKGVLTVGSIELCVERGLDWEASPRVETMIFAGLNANGVSVWGKRVAN
ncbi:MAG: glycoside hydrolase family 43 protein [Mangrovibacterium sp.]